MNRCPNCRRLVAASLCACISVDVATGSQELCWSALPRTVAACSLGEAVLPHIELSDTSSVQLSAGVMHVSAAASGSTTTVRAPFVLGQT
jgi:hypothetical protein